MCLWVLPLADLSVQYNVTGSLTGSGHNAGETIAAVTAVPGGCTGSPGNLNCALVAGVAAVT